MKKIISIVVVIFTFYLLSCIIHPYVEAAYVLPYPSYMPGNKLYRISRLIDTINKFWYAGNIAQVKYHLSLSDKYLVEAKTLFEYKQYLLAVDALHRSREEFDAIPFYVAQGKKEGKDMSMFEQIISDATIAHREVLDMLKNQLPKDFYWQPEKSQGTNLSIEKELDTVLESLKK